MFISPNVSAEARGKARSLLDRVQRADEQLYLDMRGVQALIRDRLDNGKLLRLETVQAVVRAYSRIGTDFRLTFRAQTKKWPCWFEELRICDSLFGHSLWGSSTERGVTIARLSIQFTRDSCSPAPDQALFRFGMHAIGRRFQRGVPNAESDVLADIASVMGFRCPDSEDERIAIHCASGIWVGVAQRGQVWVRTFYAKDDVPDNVLALTTYERTSDDDLISA